MRFLALLISLLAFAVRAMPIIPAQPNYPFSGITVFGDSLSDNGSAPGSTWVYTNHTLPADPAYFNATARRWSNSFVWTERLANNLSVPLTDYAIGGATSNNTLVPGILGPYIIPDTIQQYAEFAKTLRANPKDISKELFIIVIGGNDAFNSAEINLNPNTTASYNEVVVGAGTVATISWIVTSLTRIGAKNVFLATMPDLATIPIGASLGPSISAWQASMNSHMYAFVDSWKKSTTGVKVSFGDYFHTFAPVIANPQTYGFSAGSAVPCVVGTYGEAGYSLCSTDPAVQDTHVFWDAIHPTGPGHEIIKNLALAALSETY